MKRIGIITHYHNSRNYGGVLQAYALVKVLTEMGLDAEQICWSSIYRNVRRTKRKGLVQTGKRVFWDIYTRMIRKKLQARDAAFASFREQIPHSRQIYDASNVHECADRYDVFVTGSDQVWNMDWYEAAYFLDFAPAEKPKFSYAASMPNTELTQKQEACVQDLLLRFTALSVREHETAEYLTKLTGQVVSRVLDPTLLLDRQQWDAVCTPRAVKEPYIFCYFLGTEEQHRHIATQFAKEKGYPVVTLPYLNRVNGQDFGFGKIRAYDVSPEAFISLIKHAEYVLTDSFHAAVFSSLYQKEFFVFGRSEHKNASNRIYSLTKLFGTEARFCDTAEKLDVQYLLRCEPLDDTVPAPEFAATKKRSLEYLSKIQDAAKEQMKTNEN